MMKKGMRPVLIGLLSVTLSGCFVPRKGGFDDVANRAEKRLGQRVEWIQNTPEDQRVASVVDSVLAFPLSVDGAVQIALLNNRALQARYEELGLAQADLVQAGLLSNPVFSTGVRFASSYDTHTDFSVTQNFLELMMRPARKGLAETQFEVTGLHVGDAIINMAADARIAYYTLQGAMHRRALLKTVIEAASVAAEFARRQHRAGNISDLDLTTQLALYEQARLDLVASEAAILADRERMTRLMGLWGEQTNWTVPERLPDIPDEEIRLDGAEAVALSQRLDLAATRREIEVFARAHAIALSWRYFSLVEVGVESEQERDEARLTGPHLEVALPVFDRGQAQIARAEALVRQSRQRLTAQAVAIRSETRDARNRLLTARAVADHYRLTLIPLREQLVAETQRHYNYMLSGVYQLLQAKQDEISAYQGYIEAVRDYWIARCELERALGGRLMEDIPDPDDEE